MIQTQANGEKPSGPDLGPLNPNLSHHFFFFFFFFEKSGFVSH